MTAARLLQRQVVGLAVLAVAAGVAALWLAVVIVPGLHRALAAGQQAAGAARVEVLQAAVERRAVHRVAPPDLLFRAAFPSAADRGRRVSALLGLAVQHGLVSPRSEYRLQPEVRLGLAAYRVDLPVAGSYPALRAFIEDALRADPALALEQLRLRRARAASGEVEAELQFRLWMAADADLAGAVVTSP